MEKKLLHEIRLLKWLVAALTLAVVFLFVKSFYQGRPSRLALEELDVERINVVEKNGALKMVISNQARQHPGMAEGKEFPDRKREAGIIFFNASGDECGGLVYDGNKQEAGFAVSVDQFRNDQIMQLQYGQDGFGDSVSRYYGLKLWDRSDKLTLAQKVNLFDSLQMLNQPDELEKQVKLLREKGLLGVTRMFAGKNNNGEVGLFIHDKAGRLRIKIFCDDANNAQMVMFDENGEEQVM